MIRNRETVGEACRRLLPADATYDTALPQSFVDELRELTAAEAPGSFVWLYDDAGGSFGRPFPLHNGAICTLAEYNARSGAAYSVPTFYRED
jgi:hypothetical protein